MVAAITLIIAFLLDIIWGDPRWLPHLIVGYGKLIALGEKILNKGNFRLIKGTLLTLSLVALTTYVGYVIMYVFVSDKDLWWHLLSGSIILFYCLANKTLIAEGKAVFSELEKGIEEGRQRLSWIVGRETDKLSAQQIRIATFETMSENLSDGVIAPLFFYAIFGIPGVMAYKMINTLDSMIGYRNDRYELFGKFAAKLDDIANFIPSRITAILILTVTGYLNKIKQTFSEGKKHKSPNAGYPQAALAFALDCRFGGPNYYHGILVNKPYIGSNNRTIKREEIKYVATINMRSAVLAVAIITGVLWWI